MKIFRTLCVLTCLLGCCSLGSFGQQTGSCQDQDLTNLGTEIAQFRLTVQAKGFSDAQAEKLVQAYQDALLTPKASACNQAAEHLGPVGQQAEAQNAPPPPAANPAAPGKKGAPGKAQAGAHATTPVPADVPAHESNPAAPADPSAEAAAAPQPAPPAEQPGSVASNPTPTSPSGGQPAAAACGNKGDTTEPTTTLGVVDVDAITITGTVSGAQAGGTVPSGGKVQVCIVGGPPGKESYTALGSPTDVKDGKFSVSLAGPPQIKVSAGQQLVAQWSLAAPPKPTAYGLDSTLVTAGDCTKDGIDQTISAPSFDTQMTELSSGSSVSITGTAPPKMSVRVCINGLQSAVSGTTSDGKFAVATKLKDGDVIVAQVINSGSYGQFSREISVGSCTSAEEGSYSTKPTLKTIPSPGGQIVTGGVSVTNGIPKYVRICVATGETGSAAPDYRQSVVTSVDANGAFRAALPNPTSSGDQVIAQSITSELDASPRTYGLISDAMTSGLRYNGFFSSFIGGVEESGYSSDNINTNAFLSLYLRSGYFGMRKHEQLGHAFWGRIRLLSAPQESAPNVVATIANPTGQLTQTTLSSVGAVIDYSVGYEFRFHQWDAPLATTRVSFIGGIGETTPLNTASPTIFNAPGINTQDCANLLNQNQGVLFSGAGLSTPACLENPASKTAYDYVAYTQQKRSGFLFKYGGGIRFARVVLPQSQGGSLAPFMLDATLGQDESVTKGKLWGPVFRLDGQYPFPIPSLASYLYIFGSSSVRLRSSQNLPTINLATPQSGVPTVPNPAVVVLSTEQPDRDFYRIGFGLNLTTLLSSWSKGSGGQQTTNSGTTSTGASAKQ